MRLIPKTLVILVFVVTYMVVGWINYTAIVEAYGSGPPYFNLTTNMDKWESPILMLAIIDISILLVSYISYGVYKNKMKNS